MRAVRAHGQPLVDDPERLAGVTGLGVDEHVRRHRTPARRVCHRRRRPHPGRTPRLLDVAPGRTGRVYADWIAVREQAWRDRITVAALDPFRGYATALARELPHATRVPDAFHVVKLGLDAAEEVCRRVQQDTTGGATKATRCMTPGGCCAKARNTCPTAPATGWAPRSPPATRTAR